MAAAQADFGDVHFDQVRAVALTAPEMEAPAAGALGAMQHALYLVDGLGGEVIELEVNGAILGL